MFYYRPNNRCSLIKTYLGIKWFLSPCKTQSPDLQCCWCSACIGAVFADTWVQRAVLRPVEMTPGPGETALFCPTLTSPSGIHAAELRFSVQCYLHAVEVLPNKSGFLEGTVKDHIPFGKYSDLADHRLVQLEYPSHRTGAQNLTDDFVPDESVGSLCAHAFLMSISQ